MCVLSAVINNVYCIIHVHPYYVCVCSGALCNLRPNYPNMDPAPLSRTRPNGSTVINCSQRTSSSKSSGVKPNFPSLYRYPLFNIHCEVHFECPPENYFEKYIEYYDCILRCSSSFRRH